MTININGTTGISGVDGSAGTPAIQGSDTNTGVSFGTNTIDLSTDGTSRLFIDSAGRLLIGTSTSQGNWNNSSGDDHLVQIESTSAFSQSWISHSTSATAGVQLDIGRSRGTSSGSTTLVNSGDLLGHLCFQGADGSDFVRAALIQAFVDGTPGANDMPGRLAFSTTADGASTPTERLRIDSDGNAYLGNVNQRNTTQLATGKHLQIADTTNGAQLSLRGQSPKLYFDITNSGNGEIYLDQSNLIFFSGSPGTAGDERIRLRSDGHMQFNGGNVSTGNGNVGRIYKFFGAANNIIVPFESSGANRFVTLEYRRTGRVNERTSQISIGENSNSQGIIDVFSSGTNGALSGGVRLENGATSWASISDIRLKNVVSRFDNALQDVSTLDAFRFTWKNDASETLQVGLSAQSVQAVLPEATFVSDKPIDAAEDDDNKYLSVRYTEVIPLLVAALQESKERIETLEARLSVLEGGAN